MLELTHVHVLFRNSHLANDFNFNVNEPVRVEVEVYVDFATSLIRVKLTELLTNLQIEMYLYLFNLDALYTVCPMSVFLAVPWHLYINILTCFTS